MTVGPALGALGIALVLMAGGIGQHGVSTAAAAPHVSAHVSSSGAQRNAQSSIRFVAHPQPVPILVYHQISTVENNSRLLVISPAEFRAQLAYLRRHHYHPVTLQLVFDAWRGKARLPVHPVVLTFDDGYASQYRYAAKLLRSYRWPAVLNGIVKNIVAGGPMRPAYVRQMIAWGWELDSHTITHHVLTRLSSAAVRKELVGSRATLRRMFRVPVNFFCYPGGDYDRRVERAVARAGYLAATGTRYAAAVPAERFALPRIYCYWGEPLSVFGRRLTRTVALAWRQERS